MTSFLPAADDGLELFAAHVAELVLELRDEGHVLSPLDQHLVESWWQAGYSLEAVLGAVRVQGPRLKARKKPPRGLPLSSMRRAVEKAAERSAALRVGQSAAESDAPPEVLGPLLEAARAARVDRADDGGSPLAAAISELEAQCAAPVGTEELYAALLGIGRRYYAACWAGLSSSDREARRERILASLPDITRGLPADVLESTLRELGLRGLRCEDPLFDPERYWTSE